MSDEEERDPNRWLVCLIAAGPMFLPAAAIALGTFGRRGADGLDAVGQVLAYAALPAAFVGALVAAAVAATPRRAGAGLLLGLLTGALTTAGTTAALFAAMLGG